MNRPRVWLEEHPLTVAWCLTMGGVLVYLRLLGV